MSSLTRIVPWSQQLVCEVLHPGDLAVDLTAGRGRDTCVLAKTVGPDGQVVAFDLQTSALEQAAEFLQNQGLPLKSWPANQILPKQPGVFLVRACHATLDKTLRHFPKAIMANLGYLPGGEKSLVTRPETTMAALHQSVELLAPRGRLAVTVYPAHPGGAEEGAAVDKFFAKLHRDQWQVLSLRAENYSEAPYLMVAERLSGLPGNTTI